jgi:hypothetical protein
VNGQLATSVPALYQAIRDKVSQNLIGAISEVLQQADLRAANASDPGFPVPMRLGTAESAAAATTLSGFDIGTTDSEDLVILTTPPLRLASKCVLQQPQIFPLALLHQDQSKQIMTMERMESWVIPIPIREKIPFILFLIMH